jgi:hypothetical protein
MTWLLVTRRPFWPSCGALGLFPGIHIAQFPFQVIGNCGVISLMQCSNRYKIEISASPVGTPARMRSGALPEAVAGTAPAIVGWRCAHYDGIVEVGLTRIRARAG